MAGQPSLHMPKPLLWLSQPATCAPADMAYTCFGMTSYEREQPLQDARWRPVLLRGCAEKSL